MGYIWYCMGTVRHLVTLAVLAVFVGTAPAAPSASERLGAIEFALALDRPAYPPGTSVRFTLTVTNTGAEPATIQFPTSQLFDALVVQGDRLIWQWSAGRVFLQVLSSLTLAPGESRATELVWDQRDAAGRQVPAGAYTAEARFPVMGAPQVTLRRSFQITAAAGEPPAAIGARAAGPMGEVLVDGQVVLRMRAAAGGLSPVERAAIIAARLRTLVSEGMRQEELRVATVSGQAAVVARGRLVVTADTVHARLNRSTPAGLARLWRQQIAAALAP